jgi:hypothetical protein
MISAQAANASIAMDKLSTSTSILDVKGIFFLAI